MIAALSILDRVLKLALMLAGLHTGPAPGRAILVSIDERHLWYVIGKDVIMEADVAVGVDQDFLYQGKKYHVDTPRGQRTVLRKQANPIWIVPEWHYFEKAVQQNLDVVFVQKGVTYNLGDETFIQVKDNQVGRVNRYGNFWPFTPGVEIIFYGKIYIPPMGTVQREAPDVLGPYKLDMGGGYLIHGTNEDNEDSIGRAVSHGCVRMHNDDLERLYSMVEVGTPVFIY
jgi:hypothetical protein